MNSKTSKSDTTSGPPEGTFHIQTGGVLVNQKRSSPTKKNTSQGTRLSSNTNEEVMSSPSVAMASLPAKANKLVQEAKSQMEQSGNIKGSIKTTVLKKISELYDIVMRLAESRETLQRNLELLKLEKERAKNLPTPLQNKLEPETTHTTPITTELVKYLISKLEDHTNSLAECKEKLEDHKKSLSDCKEHTTTLTGRLKDITTGQLLTYAQAASTTNKRPLRLQEPLHLVIISSSEAEDTSGGIINKIRTAVDAKQTGLKVDRVRKAKDQKVVLGCKTKEELKKVADRIKSIGKDLNVEEAKNKDPLIIIKDVFNYNSDEDILLFLKNQNKHLLEGIPAEDLRLVPKYRRRTRNEHQSHIVVQVSPRVWSSLTSIGRIHIDLQRVKVEDQSPLVQCSRCLGYGHGRKHCTETADICSHCGGPHMKADCEEWLAHTLPTCRNCLKADLERKDHNAFDSNCPVRKRWDALARSSVAYC
ncbi:hypothetical protein O0L34_g11087 [Tuta absoluta]|nr:hypothetical protein O0L34_g11087 [Tuta absoluta]